MAAAVASGTTCAEDCGTRVRFPIRELNWPWNADEVEGHSRRPIRANNLLDCPQIRLSTSHHHVQPPPHLRWRFFFARTHVSSPGPLDFLGRGCRGYPQSGVMVGFSHGVLIDGATGTGTLNGGPSRPPRCPNLYAPSLMGRDGCLPPRRYCFFFTRVGCRTGHPGRIRQPVPPRSCSSGIHRAPG